MQNFIKNNNKQKQMHLFGHITLLSKTNLNNQIQRLNIKKPDNLNYQAFFFKNAKMSQRRKKMQTYLT